MTPAVHDEVVAMYAHCKESLTGLHGNELMEELGKTLAWMARTGEVLSEAIEELATARGKAANRVDPAMTATQAKSIVEGAIASELGWVKLVERLNAMLVHRADGLRSMLSYTKAQRNQYGQGDPTP